jgi:hypothetical protein
MDLDTDTTRLVQRLADIQARIADLNADAEAIKAELRNLPVGDHMIDGRPALRLIPNRRFNVNAGAELLPAEVRTECLAVTYDPAKVKKHLSEIQIDQCMVEAGKPKVVLA